MYTHMYVCALVKYRDDLHIQDQMYYNERLDRMQ